MDLSNELISQFAKLTSDNSKSSETVVYGTVTESEGSMYVIIDGSDILTPITTTANIKDGQRVTVMIKDHTATVTGNITSPSVGNDVVDEAKEEVKMEITATNANITTLNTELANIKTLVSGNLTSDNILSFLITADKVTMDDAFIKDAHIANVNANKINAGVINTSNVSVVSEDGGLSIADETMQFKDENGIVRIQIGRDSNNNFTFVLYDETGRGQLINADGIQSSDAIKDGLIRDGHVSDDAAIRGSKLDISSVITEINEDNSTTLKSSKIYLDEKGQSLEVAFNSLSTKVDTIQEVTITGDLTAIVEQVQSNTTEINVVKGDINTLVAENTTIKESVQKLNGELETVSTTLSSKYSSLEQDVSKFKTTVSETYATKDALKDYSTTTQMNSAIEQKATGILSTVSATYATNNDISNTYATKSELNQTANSWTATFESGYSKGIVKMDQWGIKVTHSDFAGWSHITSSGFYINNGEEDVIQLTTSGLQIKGAIKGGSTIDIGTSDDGTRSAFQVASNGVVGIGNTITLNGVTYPAFRVGNTGNLKVGGASAYVHPGDGKRKGVAEITSEGTIWSCSETLPYTYARLTEGKLEISNTAHDPEYNGGSYVKDSYIKLENGQIAIYSASDANYSNYVRSIYMNQEGIGSALGHVDFVNRINVTGNVTTTGKLILSSNNNGIKGTDTDGEEITLAHVGADNVCKFGYGSWASQGSYAYNEGTEFMGGETATLKAKNKVWLSCNHIGDHRIITFHNDSTGSYVFRPNGTQKDILCGTSNYPWKKVYAQSGCETTSDRTEKENIQYLSYDNINTLADINDTITTNECLDFITNDYLLATYNYTSDVNKETKLSAIAQDVIVNIDGSDNKIGQLIVDAKGSAKEEALLCMNQTQLLNVAIGAIQQLNVKVNELENRLKNS